MATTPNGFPYPIGTDRIVDGDDAIRALAEAVDAALAMTRFGAGESPWIGPAPPAGTRKIIKQGSVVLTTNPFTALWAITYPTPFPNGVVTCVVTPGDNASSLGSLTLLMTSNLATVYGIAFTADGLGIGEQMIRVNYLAIGW